MPKPMRRHHTKPAADRRFFGQVVQSTRLGDGFDRQWVDHLWHYKTKVGSPDEHDLFYLTGFATEDLISFTVNFGKFSTLTSWAGQYAKEKEEPER